MDLNDIMEEDVNLFGNRSTTSICVMKTLDDIYDMANLKLEKEPIVELLTKVNAKLGFNKQSRYEKEVAYCINVMLNEIVNNYTINDSTKIARVLVNQYIYTDGSNKILNKAKTSSIRFSEIRKNQDVYTFSHLLKNDESKEYFKDTRLVEDCLEQVFAIFGARLYSDGIWYKELAMDLNETGTYLGTNKYTIYLCVLSKFLERLFENRILIGDKESDKSLLSEKMARSVLDKL